jgi:hypothetical protein
MVGARLNPQPLGPGGCRQGNSLCKYAIDTAAEASTASATSTATTCATEPAPWPPRWFRGLAGARINRSMLFSTRPWSLRIVNRRCAVSAGP